jgi:integrase
MKFTNTEEIKHLPFKQAALAWLETRRPFLGERTFKDYGIYIELLAKFFKRTTPTEITADQIREYQRMRMGTAGGSIINHECCILQQLLKRIGRWGVIADDYQPLPLPKQGPGRVLSDHEREKLFRAAKAYPQWEIAYLFAVISVNTSAGPKEVFTIRLKDANMVERTIRIQPEGAKNAHRVRIIPLNEIAYAAVDRALELAKRRGSIEPHHYVFPFRVNRGKYDPTRHCTTVKTAWHQVTGVAGLTGLRPYDLRHTAITDLLSNPEVSEETVKAIAGHISDQILKTYSHIRMDAKKHALDALVKVSTTPKKPKRKSPLPTTNVVDTPVITPQIQ